MKFLRLKIENFLVLTEAEVRLDDRGLILVQGQNLADSSANSNGSGKSSIADALCWAVYGTTARGESGDAVVNNRAGKNTRVEVTIEDEGVIYTIARHRKHKTHKNNVTVHMDAGQGEKDLTLGTDKLTQGLIDKIIGCSLEVFTGSIYAGQERMPDLPSMTDKMLKILIEEAAGINQLEEAYVLARSKAQTAKLAYDNARNVLTQNEAQASMLESQRSMAEQDHQLWEQSRKDSIAQTQEHIDTVLRPEHGRLHQEIINADRPSIEAEIQSIDTRLAQVSAQSVEMHKLDRAVALTQSTIRVTENDARRALADYQRTQKAIEEVRHKVGCPCDSCGRPLTPAELAVAEQNAIDTHDQSRAMVVAVKGTLADAQRAHESAVEAADAFRATLTDVSAETARRAALEASLRACDDLVRRSHDVLTQINARLADVDRMTKEQSPFLARIEALDTQITAARALVSQNERELAERLAALDLEQEVVRVFSPAGVRARILDEVTPYLNAQTSRYLSVLSDGNISAQWSTLTPTKGGEMKERFAIDVTSTASAQSFKGLSGGEKRKVRVATALALQDLVSTRASKPINLFIGDEIDDALDVSGLERLMIILREKAQERGTVLVISHRSLKDEISQILTVERQPSGETAIFETAA